MKRISQRKVWMILLAAVVLLVPFVIYAASQLGADGLYDFTASTVISSSEVNANFDVLSDKASDLDDRLGTYEDAITVDGNGNVGVGTLAPAGTLDVSSVHDPSLFLSRPGLASTSSAHGVGKIVFHDTDHNSNIAEIQSVMYPPGTEGDLTFRTMNGGKVSEKVRITASGNVGIGTSYAAEKLSVAGNMAMTPSAGANRYILLYDGGDGATYTGALAIQAGGGSVGWGGGLVLYSHANTNHPGDVVAGISADSGGAFRVNSYGIDGGTDLFTVKQSGKVGIGTTSPLERLDVRDGNISLQNGYSLKFYTNGGVNWQAIDAGNNTTFLVHSDASSKSLAVTHGGNVGINTTSPAYRLDVNGNLRAYGITDASSRQYKEHIRSLEADDALKALSALRPTRYQYKQDPSEERLGFIAEEVPELVAMKDREGVASMDIVAVLTKVVQQQQAQLADQKAQLDAMRRELRVMANSSKR